MRALPCLFALGLLACGGSSSRSPGAPSGAGSTSDCGTKDTKTASSAPPAALGPLPPMAKMPRPGVVGSRKVEVRAAPAKMAPVGAAFRGTQADRDPHQEHKVRVAKGKCVRGVLTVEGGGRDIVVVARDDAGDIIAESSASSVPESGAMCFREDGELALLVGVGTGKATYALQLWGD